MKPPPVICILVIFGTGILLGFFIRPELRGSAKMKEYYSKWFRKGHLAWGKEFELVKIKSELDRQEQKAYFFKTKSTKKRPLVVSLHTWGGSYSQHDEFAQLCVKHDLNYIHPDFRGPNNSTWACCSNFALNDIDESIKYALSNSNVDTSRIFVVGASGGGYAAICTFMKSRYKINCISAWASITDLISFYEHCLITDSSIVEDILLCTESKNGVLNLDSAKSRSPMYWPSPIWKTSNSKLFLYAGINDGIVGTVPFIHSVNFYNKLLSDLAVSDSSRYVTDKEKLELLEFRKPLKDYGKISNRNICLLKEYMGVKLVIFDGGHEILAEFALNELLGLS
jgi:pimeloyl-ACP methyl ester carboxylesterase